MAQDGDTITYTYSDGRSVSEDVSAVNEMTVDYLDGSGGGTPDDGKAGGSGGRVENTVVDLSDVNEIYLWVGSYENDSDFNGSRTAGRYSGEVPAVFSGTAPGNGGATTEVSLVNTNQDDSDTEPFIVAAGGGSGGSSADNDGGVGARNTDYIGTPPPQGADAPSLDSVGLDGEGAVAGHNTNATIKETGTTITGGGSSSDNTGEIQVTYTQVQSPPDPPSNLTAEVQ